MDEKNGIGRDGELAWQLPSDMAYFKEKTSTTIDPKKKNAVLMGRKTYESIPKKFRPLPKRLNIILTKNTSIQFPDCLIQQSIESAITTIQNRLPEIETLFIIGGGQIYKETLTKKICSKLWITHLFSDFNCTTTFPKIPKIYSIKNESKTESENNIKFKFVEYLKQEP